MNVTEIETEKVIETDEAETEGVIDYQKQIDELKELVKNLTPTVKNLTPDTEVDVAVEVDNSDLYKKVAEDVVKKNQLLQEIENNEFFKQVISSVHSDISVLDTQELEKAISIARASSKVFTPVVKNSTRKLTTAEALDAWEKEASKSFTGRWK